MLLTILLTILFIVATIAIAKGSLITKVENTNVIHYNSNSSLNSSFNSFFDLITNKKMKKYELVGFVSSINKMAYPPIHFLETTIFKSNSLFKDLMLLLNEGHDYDLVNTYFTSINDLLEDFSEHCKSYCLDVMHSAKKHGVFSVKEQNAELEKKANVEKGGALLFAAATAFMSGDIVAPISVFLSDDKVLKQIDKSLDVDFDYSKVYCINSFSLFFALESDKQRDNKQSVTIVGDKIPYEYFLDHLNSLKAQITTNEDDNKNKKDSVFLENILEQLEALKIVVTRLDELVVFELHDKLTNLIKEGSSFSKIQKYLSKKVFELVTLKQDLLSKDFPISNADLLEQVRLNAVKREIERIKHTDRLTNTRQVSEQRVTKNALQHELNENEFTAWATLYVYGPLKRTSSLIVRAVVSLPHGITVGGLQGIYDFLESICNIFAGSPVTTGLIIVTCLAVVYSSVSTIVSWIFFPFVFIFRKMV